MSWYHKHKRNIAAAMGVCVAVGSIAGFTGCGKEAVSSSKSDENGKKASEEKAMGRYLEEELAVPEGCSQIIAMELLENETMRLVYFTEDGVQVSDSKDRGKTWEAPKNMRELAKADDNLEFGSSVALAKDGGIFTTFLEMQDEENYVLHYFYISPTGEAKELDLNEAVGGSVFSCSFSDKGNLLLSSSNGVQEIDPQDGGVVHTYDAGSMVTIFDTVGSRLISVVDTEIHYYDMETGKPLEEEEVLTKEISSNPDNLEMTGLGINNLLFIDGDEKDSLFYVSHDGIYRYAFGGSVVEQVADGKLNSLSSPDIAFTAMVRDKDGAFYLAVSDMSQSDPVGRICKYVYSKDTPAVPDTELTVYSLTDDDFLRQAAAAFQKKYPDIYLNLETGMTGEDAVTETDALKALNTEIMAGKGPDILLMDGIAADTYIEKGMLEDLSEILKDADILENIIEPYKDGNGKIYQMPVKFGIPYIQGKKEYVDAISDLTSMADTIESHKEEYTKDTLPIVSSYSPYMLLKGLSAVNMSAWVNEDGTLNQAAVQEFLEQTNRIYQSAKAPAEELLAAFGTTVEEMEEANEVRNLYSEFGAVFSKFGVGGLDLISESNILGTGGVYSPSDLRSIYSVEQQGDGISGKLWNGQTKDAFIPQKIVGISAKSSEKEAAEKFVGYLFSDEGQRVSTTSGLPVRKSVYEDISYWMGNAKEGDVTSVTSSYNNQTGESVDLSIVQPGESVIKEIQELGKTLTTPVKENRMILSAVLDAGASYIKGEISVEEAVEKAASQVNLYLSE